MMRKKKKKVSATVQLRVRERCDETERELLLLRGSEARERGGERGRE